MLEVLSVGKGDIKLSIDPSNPKDVENARKMIEEMFQRGYGVFVETDTGLKRVKRFNAKRMTYVVSEIPDTEPKVPAGEKPKKPRRVVEKQVPVAGTKAKAIGRTAGG